MATSVEEGRDSCDSAQASGSIDANVDTERLASTEDERNRFLDAVSEGNIDLVKRLLESGVDLLSARTDRGWTALHLTAENGNVEMAELLLSKDESLKDVGCTPYNSLPLHNAAWFGTKDMCALLLQKNASLAPKNSGGYNVLHAAFLGPNESEEVVRVLMSAGGSASLMEDEDNSGNTPLDYAFQYEKWNASLVAWVLSKSSNPASYFTVAEKRWEKNGKPNISEYLRESTRMGSGDLVQKLRDGGADPFEGDNEGKTTLDYIVEAALDVKVAMDIIEKLLFDKKKGSIQWGEAFAGGKFGRNFFHTAASLGKKDLCHELIDRHINLMDAKDRDGRSPIFYAVEYNDPRLLELIISRAAQATNIVLVKDSSETTLLHVAAAAGHPDMVESLLARFPTLRGRMDWVRARNGLGQTVLHKAARGGHWEVVKMLLANGAHPFKERAYEGKTALHYAAEAENGENAVKIAELLLGACESGDQRSLLVFASTVGIGLPNFSLPLRNYLDDVKQKIEEPKNLLRIAARFGDIDSTISCITRGQNIALIRSEEWRAKLPNGERKNVLDVLEKIKAIVEQGTDKPAMQDYLGRSPYAIGLAAFFLNPFMRSPITVGISGEWGMGKSSVMLQTETILLNTAAELVFSKSFQQESGMGSKPELSVTGLVRLREIANTIKRFDATSGDNPEETKQTHQQKLGKVWKTVRALWNKSAPSTTENLNMFKMFLENNQSKHQPIFKSLAVMDRHDMFEEKKETASRKTRVGELSLEEDSLHGITPAILTIRYNAWHYRNETEAWAGLAVQITKELEATMTVAHKLRTSWRYNWKNSRESICLNVIFPFILQVVVAIFLSVIVWLVFGTAHNKDIKKLKYGGVPASMIVAAWGLGKSVVSFVKPITSQVQEYLCLPDHSQKLGYHQKVIDDINFLKEELSYRPSWTWKIFAFIWSLITWSWDENYVPGTKIRKFPPAAGNNLRMIVFVDDLDRCEQSVILQVLSAVNLVLATCEINVILSMENSMIERAIIRKYGNKDNMCNKSNEELADNYLRKIVQLPLHLPDPSEKESSDFLERQLGIWDSRKGSNKVNPNKRIENESVQESEDRQRRALGPDISEHSRVDHMNEEEEQAINIHEEGDQDHEPENRKIQRSLLSIISAMLIPKYNQGERNAFRFLHTRCTRSRKLPREWKCFMTYHRLGWNIMSLSPDIIQVQGWQVQFIAWIFVCWQWRHLLTTLIQKWDKLNVLIKRKAGEAPSLRDIVDHYIEKELADDLKMRKTSGNLPQENITDGDYYLKELLGKVLREQEEMREVLKMSKKDVCEDKGERSVKRCKAADEEREEWNKLRNTLQRYNVSMEGIQAFQKFRFYCQPGHLPWPLPEQD